MCGNDCDLPTQTVTSDRDEQNDAVYGRMWVLTKRLLLLDDYCMTENNTEDNTTSSVSILCETVRSELHRFTQKITNYVRKKGPTMYDCDYLLVISPSW